ncbi:GyrI-like domain-containing protein [Maribacter forsetii]|uniref:GyrI-like domain-containing protein n=1 Tax=Maribacter forsetii TaxID=444515 RepID=UPI00056B1E39|nr:GyrI-like domain-containing protein [Maribacter forsetii]
MRKAITVTIFIICIGLLWYFLLKPQDYQIRVVAKSFPGTINQSLKSWNNSIDNASIVQLEDLKHLKQTIKSGDSTHTYIWNIFSLNDSTSKIKVDVTDLDNSFNNKLLIPFTDTDFEKGSRKLVTDFISYLNKHRKEFKVTILNEEKLPNIYCACVKHKTIQSKKAIAMKDSYPFLNSVLVGNGLKLNGVPFIETTDWNIANDSLAFDFCYPILKVDSLPVIKDITYKEFNGLKSLKAIYNGNYITSDRAWYALLDYAEKNNIAVNKKPIEFFYNNPNMGGDALYWKTEVFMPLTEQDE